MLRVLIDVSCGTEIRPSHPMVGGFYDALYKTKQNLDSVVESFARIPSSIPVLPHPEKCLCVYDARSAMLLILSSCLWPRRTKSTSSLELTHFKVGSCASDITFHGQS